MGAGRHAGAGPGGDSGGHADAGAAEADGDLGEVDDAGAATQVARRPAGKFDFAGKFWMEPGAPPQAAKGVAERTLLLGGRVLQEKVTSSLMGMPLDGLGLAGYDNVSASSGRPGTTASRPEFASRGQVRRGDEELRLEGTYSNPDTGKSQAVRLELRSTAPTVRC